MNANQKVGKDQYWDAAAECASAAMYSAGTVAGAISAQPWLAAPLGFNAITASTACIAKIASISSGQTVGQYTQLSGAMALLDPWGLLLAAGTGGDTLMDSGPTNVFSAGQSQTELLYEVLSAPRKLRGGDFFQFAGDLIKYGSSAPSMNPKPDRPFGVTLLDKPADKLIPSHELPPPQEKKDE